jgi:hypothetical protein
MAVIDPENGNPSGALAKRTQSMIEKLYKTNFPDIYRALEAKANDNGESIRRGANAGKYAAMLFDLQDYIEAIGVQYGYLKAKNAPQPTPETGGQQLDQLMQQMPVGDSVLQ